MTERAGNSQGSGLEQRPRNRRLNMANILIITGALVTGGVIVDLLDKALTEGDRGVTSAGALVRDYEKTTVTLGEEGKLDQIPQKFDPQKVEAAYKKLNSEDATGDLVAGVAGIGIIFVGVMKKSQESSRRIHAA